MNNNIAKHAPWTAVAHRGLKYIALCAVVLVFAACSEQDLPTAQVKPALDKAQQATDQATQYAKDMAEQAELLQ